MENELNARFQHAVIGEGNTSTSSKPLRGEIVFDNTLTNFRVGTDGNTPYSSLTDFLHNFTGADTSSNGTAGLVPAPSVGDQTKFLRGDGTWQNAGGSYTLPVATSSALGGIKIGYQSNAKNYPVQLGSNTGDTGTASRAYVNVPWTDSTYTFTINGKENSDTDLSNGGIYAPTEHGSAGNLLIANDDGVPVWADFSDNGFLVYDKNNHVCSVDTNNYLKHASNSTTNVTITVTGNITEETWVLFPTSGSSISRKILISS